jgi:hypothetical protein
LIIITGELAVLLPYPPKPSSCHVEDATMEEKKLTEHEISLIVRLSMDPLIGSIRSWRNANVRLFISQIGLVSASCKEGTGGECSALSSPKPREGSTNMKFKNYRKIT